MNTRVSSDNARPADLMGWVAENCWSKVSPQGFLLLSLIYSLGDYKIGVTLTTVSQGWWGCRERWLLFC